MHVLLALALSASPALVVGTVDDGHVVSRRVVFLHESQHTAIALAVIEPDGRCFGGSDEYLRETRCAVAPDDARRSVRWMLVVPIASDYDNVARCGDASWRGCHDPIRYREEELTALRGRFEFDATDDPRLSSPGTHRLVARLRWHGETLAFPASATEEADNASAGDLLEIVVRHGDGYVGYLTELLGVPFALGPVWMPGAGHQTDLRLAADCVALVVYGRRRMGEAVPYAAPPMLRNRLEFVGSAPALMSEVGTVADVGEVKPGDVLHFGFQTAVLSRDFPPIGRLDAGDLARSFTADASDRRAPPPGNGSGSQSLRAAASPRRRACRPSPSRAAAFAPRPPPSASSPRPRVPAAN